MDLEEVNIIRPKTLQAPLHTLHDLFWRNPDSTPILADPWKHLTVACHLSGQYYLISLPLLEPFAQDAVCLAKGFWHGGNRVNLGSILS